MALELIELSVVSQTLHKHPAVTWSLLLDGKLRGQKIGRRWYVESSSVSEYLARHAEASAPTAA